MAGLRQWLIDAFSGRPFGGNQAWVCEPLAAWPSSDWMQALAMENNVGATAFLTRTDQPDRFGLRWFTPSTEVPLCGHATLAAAHMLLAELGLAAGRLQFETRGGLLEVEPVVGSYAMSLPALPSRRIETPAGLADALGAEPVEVWRGHYLIALLDSAGAVRNLKPDIGALEAISRGQEGLGNAGVAAPGQGTDVIDRFFAPGFGLPEDPATGSFHAQLAPIMADRLGRKTVTCHQAYPGRGADLVARLTEGRVELTGQAVTVAEGRLRVATGS